MKETRHEAILDIIREKNISTQEELQNELRLMGFDVTQATVSRDIRRLRLVKHQISGGKSVYTVPAEPADLERERLLKVLRHSIRSVENGQNILVIKTEAGMAMAAGAAIDKLSMKEIIGCIAGDDTILAVLGTAEAAAEARRKLSRDLDLADR